MNKSETSDDQMKASAGRDEPATPVAELSGDERTTQSQPASEVQTRFAWLRTRMALQTTLAAWVRTATSLIGFGFAIVQFFEHFGFLESGGAPKAPQAARIIGLILIGAGSLTTAIATWEYRTAVKYLEGDEFRGVAGIPTLRHEPPDVAVWMAFLVFLIGILAFGVILTTNELR
jgi:putative membrane protein